MIIGLSELAADGKLYNAAAVFQRGRVSGLYRKMYPAIRQSVYTAGSRTPVFRAGDLRFSILICNDSNYPELATTMCAHGATVLFIPTNNGLPKYRASATLNSILRICDIAMAVENRYWIVRADVSGETGKLISFGCSEIVDPFGAVVHRSPDTDLLIADIPMGKSGSM
jgi:5-aminopentanamidase